MRTATTLASSPSLPNALGRSQVLSSTSATRSSSTYLVAGDWRIDSARCRVPANARPAVLVVVVMFLCGIVSAQAPESWFLMARHGECAQLSSLERKIPDLGAPSGLDELLEILKNKGLSFHRRTLAIQNGEAVELNVPELSLTLVLVPSALCSEFLEHR